MRARILTPALAAALLFGFGFECISSQDRRNAVMRRVLRHMLD
jgi:hypothetical protein